MKQFIKNLPMRRKLVLIIVTVCSAVLILTCLALFWFQSVAFRKSTNQSAIDPGDLAHQLIARKHNFDVFVMGRMKQGFG